MLIPKFKQQSYNKTPLDDARVVLIQSLEQQNNNKIQSNIRTLVAGQLNGKQQLNHMKRQSEMDRQPIHVTHVIESFVIVSSKKLKNKELNRIEYNVGRTTNVKK